MSFWFGLLFSFCFLQTVAQEVPVNGHFIDSTTAPGDDFYRFANGRWLTQTTIPPGQGMWAPIVAIAQKNDQFVKNCLRRLTLQHYPRGSAAQVLGDFYASGLDTNRIERLGYSPLVPYLKAVNQIRSRQGLLDFIARHITTSPNALINLYAEPDARNKRWQVATLGQAGLAFSASYYLNQNEKSARILRHYQRYLTQQLSLIGYAPPQAAAAAERVLVLERQIASSHYSPDQLSQASLTYNILSRSELNQRFLHLNWPRFFALTRTLPKRVNLAQPAYYQLLDSLIDTVPLSTWRDKLRVDYLTAHASKLSYSFRQTHRTFFKETLGNQRQTESWNEAILSRITYPLRDLVGQLYVQQHFSSARKREVLQLASQMRTVYANRLRAASWLSEQARAAALHKLRRMAFKIGYPDRWDSYVGTSIRRNDFFGNTLRLLHRSRSKNLGSFDQPTDDSAWRFMVAGLGASFSNTDNALTLTAGYLQTPYFWPGADPAITYATVGRTIGHELTHAFDTQGYRFDAWGNVSPWFNASDSAAFSSRYLPLLEQFNQYSKPDSLNLNGRRTIGENIADLIGLSVAYQALTATNQFKKNVLIDGLTPAQRFFLAYAQEQRTLYTPAMRRFMLTDAHPLEEFRVNGTLSNFSPFYDAFNVQPNHKLYKPLASRVVIW